MTHEEKMKQCRDIFDHCLAVIDAKGKDYSGTDDAMSNFRDFGYKGIIVRLGDKYQRLKNFVKQEKLTVDDESVFDTLVDNINYSALCIIQKSTEDLVAMVETIPTNADRKTTCTQSGMCC